MDQLYEKDPDHQLAWELFKEEAGDAGTSKDPERVPVGIGHTYLRKVKAGGGRGISKKTAQKTGSIQGFILLGFLLVVIYMMLKAYSTK
jgi:hypothetical protein